MVAYHGLRTGVLLTNTGLRWFIIRTNCENVTCYLLSSGFLILPNDSIIYEFSNKDQRLGCNTNILPIFNSCSWLLKQRWEKWDVSVGEFSFFFSLPHASMLNTSFVTITTWILPHNCFYFTLLFLLHFLNNIIIIVSLFSSVHIHVHVYFAISSAMYSKEAQKRPPLFQ